MSTCVEKNCCRTPQFCNSLLVQSSKLKVFYKNNGKQKLKTKASVSFYGWICPGTTKCTKSTSYTMRTLLWVNVFIMGAKSKSLWETEIKL